MLTKNDLFGIEVYKRGRIEENGEIKTFSSINEANEYAKEHDLGKEDKDYGIFRADWVKYSLTKERIYELWNEGDIECLTLRYIYDESIPEGEPICEPAQYVIRYKGKEYIEIPHNDGYDSDTELLEQNMDYIIASLNEKLKERE